MHNNLSVEGLDQLMREEFVDWFKNAVKTLYIYPYIFLPIMFKIYIFNF